MSARHCSERFTRECSEQYHEPQVCKHKTKAVTVSPPGDTQND